MHDICAEHGWATESHTITTEDGYILELYRIPGTINEVQMEGASPKPAVLLQHAMECDMMEWVLNDYERAPAFILAREGYDVWLGNNRGTKYGLQHVSLDPKSAAFWDHDWEQMGVYDVPAIVDKILDVTGLENVSYVGHSEGTTQFMVGSSLKPDYFKEKINFAGLLAPIARLDHNEATGLSFLAKPVNIKLIEKVIVDGLGFYNWDTKTQVGQHALSVFCGLFDGVCSELSKFMTLNPEVDNTDRLTTYISFLPAGNGWRNFAHYGQVISSAKF
jgi:pimeloyl-ACP methyl ester carboxylesterase